MARVCSACSKKIGMFAEWQSTKNGCICSDCYARFRAEGVGVNNLSDDEVAGLYDRLLSNDRVVRQFPQTDYIGNKLGYAALFDEKSKMALLPKRISPVFEEQGFWAFSYDDLLSVELLCDDKPLEVSELGNAVLGAFALGLAGAAIGVAAAQLDRMTKRSVSIVVSLKVNNYLADSYEITFFDDVSGVDGQLADVRMSYAVDLVERLQSIIGTPSVTKAGSAVPDGSDTVDELRKYKQLLDEGIINQDEFNAKKKILLGI